MHDFLGDVQKFPGEVQNDLRGGPHLPSKSGLDEGNNEGWSLVRAALLTINTENFLLNR